MKRWRAGLALASAIALCTTAPTALAQPAQSADGVLRPFGPGTLVRFQSTGATTTVYVADTKGRTPPLEPSDFTRLGTTPLTAELPPGTYVVEVGGRSVSAETEMLRVGEEPMRIAVAPGNADLSELGSIGLAFGIAAVLTGAGLLIIDATSDTRSVAEGKLGLPLLIAGGVVGLGGLAATVAGDTSIRDPVPLQRPAPRSHTSWSMRLTFRF